MPGTGNKKASSNNSSEKLFLGASAEGSARDVSITTPQTPLAASLFCPRAASGAASACFQGWGPVLVGTSHTLKRGPHTGTRAHTEPKSHNRPTRGGPPRLLLLLCSSRLRRPRPAAAAHLHLLRRYHTLLHHHAVTTIAITYIICRCLLDIVLGEELCPLVSRSVKSRG